MIWWWLACADAEKPVPPVGPGDSASSVDTGDTAPVLPAGTWATISGEPADALGNEVAAAGDLDGDGDDDLLIAAYLGNRVCAVAGPVPAGHATLDASGAACLTGETEMDYAGYGMAAIGDATGDGVGDVLVGSIGNSDAGVNAGKVYLVAGPIVGGGLGERAVATWTGEATGDYAGLELGDAGDLTGDGVRDLFIGASGFDGEGGGGGRAYIVAGPVIAGVHAVSGAWATVTGLGAPDTTAGPVPPPHGAFGTGDFVGDAFAGTVDLDGDGVSDLALGASGDATLGLSTGKVSIFFGPMPAGAALVSDADLTLLGPESGAFAGSPLRAVPDLDGDGREDLLVAADGVDTVYVAGPTLTRLDDAAIRLVGDEAGALFGYALGTPADLDGDGALDLVIGAPAFDGVDVDTGAVFVFAGPFSPGSWSASQARVVLGEAEGDGFGGAVDVAGDLDQDGALDLVAGARGNTGNGGFAGRVYLLDAP